MKTINAARTTPNERFDLAPRADGLAYNLAALRFTLTGLEVASTCTPQQLCRGGASDDGNPSTMWAHGNGRDKALHRSYRPLVYTISVANQMLPAKPEGR